MLQWARPVRPVETIWHDVGRVSAARPGSAEARVVTPSLGLGVARHALACAMAVESSHGVEDVS